jgi:hypothetical protein
LVFTKKVWLGLEGQFLSSKGLAESVKSCPYRIAIISTGLVFHQRDTDGHNFVKEAGLLLKNKYGTVILDDAHKARVKGGVGIDAKSPNNLLDFMRRIVLRTQLLLLGAATPIQTKVRELWDLLKILNSGVEFVFGDSLSRWHDCEQTVPLVTSKESANTAEDAWLLLSNPLPPSTEHPTIGQIRNALEIVLSLANITTEPIGWQVNLRMSYLVKLTRYMLVWVKVVCSGMGYSKPLDVSQ